MRKYCSILSVLLFMLTILNLTAQVAVNTNGDAAHASAILDVSSTEKGMLIPRMTKSQRDNDISSPIEGLLIYQIDNTPGFYFYDGSAWVVVGNGATTINSLYDGASDGSSIFLGNGSGANDDGTSNQNLGYGINALNANTVGYENTAIGIEALKLVDGGHHNTALGIHSLSAITTGSGNTALGTNAGLSNTGSGNIFIGANAAYNELGSNKLYIHNSASATPLIYGEFDNNFLRIYGTLDINNAYQFPTTAGTNGQLLKTDGSGILSWADDTNTGATDIDGLSDGLSDGNSLYMGADAGNLAGSNKFSTGVGVWALKDVTTGLNNTALGTSSLMSLTEGSNNTVIGTNALQTITTTSNNTVLGNTAGQSVTGSGNIFIGNEAAKTQTAISNKLFIDNSDTVAPLIYGDFDNNIVRINHKLELTSDSTGSSFKLYEPDTAGTHYTMFKTRHQDANIIYKLPMENGSSDMVLKTNGVDELYWGNDNGALNINDLSDAKTGGRSVFLGEGSGNDDDGTYNYNSAIGYQSLYKNTTGQNNVAIGRWASSENTSGESNVAIGTEANSGNTAGSNNTIIGYNAGGDYSPNYSASGCVFLGYKAGYNEKSSDKLYIDNSNSSTPLIYGEFDNDLVKINGDLEITGSTNLNMAIDDLTDGKTDGSSVFLGEDAGVADDGSNSVTGVGINALNANTEGNWNCAFGKEALLANTTASENTAMGGQALTSNTTGHHNAAFGRSALSNNIVGINNTAIGADAGTNSIGSGNIFLGNNSGSNETGDNKLYIENSSSSTPLIYGEFDNDLVRINGDLEVTGTFNTYSIGDFVHGGIVFWVDETGQHGLVCSKTDQSTSIQWYNGSNDYTESRGNGIYSGEMNTTLIIARQGYNSDDYAAGLCANLEVTENSINYGDWYLPSLTELTEIYDNRTAINTTAAANSGTALSTTGSYWSSYEQSYGHAYIKKFHDGGYMFTLKSYTNYVRAVRRF